MSDDQLYVGDVVGPFGWVGQFLGYLPRRCRCGLWTCDLCDWFRGFTLKFALAEQDASVRRLADELAKDGRSTAGPLRR